jgi:hypothetical protein
MPLFTHKWLWAAFYVTVANQELILIPKDARI